MQKIPFGAASKAGFGGAALIYALAVVAYAQGDRSVETRQAITAGTVTLAVTLAGRFAQAVAQIMRTDGYGKGLTKTAPIGPVGSTLGQSMGTGSSGIVGSTTTEPRPSATITSTDPGDNEPGDPDALPDYETKTDPPPDEGDTEVAR